MKTYKQFFETADAKDYVVKDDDEDEKKELKPRSKGEKKFKDAHKVDKKKHPTADDSVHTGDIKKKVKEDDSNDKLKLRDSRKMYVGGVPAIVNRLSFTGELG